MTQSEAQDRLRCWSLMARWRKVSRLPVPAKWLVHGEPPRSPLERYTLCLLAYWSPSGLDAESPFYRMLKNGQRSGS